MASSLARSEARAFLVTFGLGALLIPAAIGLSVGLDINLVEAFDHSPRDILIGIIATVPLLAMLHWFLTTRWTPIADFTQSQIRFFAGIGFRLTPLRALALAVLAGVSEEILFRGVLQTAADRMAPTLAAILVTNILFGVLHARTMIYAIVAAAVGCYLGVLYWLTGNLAAPVITHTVYDFIAFLWTQQAIDRLPDHRARFLNRAR